MLTCIIALFKYVYYGRMTIRTISVYNAKRTCDSVYKHTKPTVDEGMGRRGGIMAKNHA